MKAAFESLREVPWWLALVAAAISLVGVLFIHSATVDDSQFAGQHLRQVVFLVAGMGIGLMGLLVPYGRLLRYAWVIYAVAVAGLLLLPVFGTYINGARRWYRFPGFTIQPSEFAKLALIVALAAYLRFKEKARTLEGLLIPIGIAAVPAFLVLRQPDLGSSLIFWPVLLAMCYAAGTPLRTLGWVVLFGAVAAIAAYFFVLRDYQLQRVNACVMHFGWSDADIENRQEVREILRGPGYQPWQSLIAIGGGGLGGFGYMAGPQNRYDFLPYRSVDYVFAVVCEEVGFVGAVGLLVLYAALILGILWIGGRCRERFGRLLAVGVATFLGTQGMVHVAVCLWLVPATGLPMPLVSYGGSSTLVALLAVALALNVGSRRALVLAPDGYR